MLDVTRKNRVPMQLKQSSVRRRGVSAEDWYAEGEDIWASRNDRGGFNFSFTLPSKGRRKTIVQLAVAESDLQALLRELARARPSAAKLFANCTQAALSVLVRSARAGKSAA